MPKVKEENMDKKLGSTKEENLPVKEDEQGGARSKFPPLPEGRSEFTLPADIKEDGERHQSIASLTKAVHELQLGMASVVSALNAHTFGRPQSSSNGETAERQPQQQQQQQQYNPQGAFSLPAPNRSDYSAPRGPLQQRHVITQSHVPVPTPPIFTEDVIFGAAIIPKDTANNAVLGNYANLSKFQIYPSPATDQECISLKDGNLTVTGKTAGRPINSYGVWLKAWANYEELLIHHHPRGAQLFSACAAYRRFIHECQELHTWSAVYGYDTAFRVNLGQTKSLDFGLLDIRCYVANLNAATLKKDNQKCFRCQAIGHTVRDCPFPEGASSQQNPQSSAAVSRKGEICNNFNAGRCNFPRCLRLHICKHCRGPKPSHLCGCPPGGQPSQ